MFLVPLSSLRVAENRQRREFKAEEVMELADSISRLGLFHPLVVRLDDGVWTLVAGERRLRAIKSIYELESTFRCGDKEVTPSFVPVLSVGELSETEAFECELEENIRRIDLSWQERAQAVAALHELRTRQDPEHSTGDTTREVYDIPADVPGTELAGWRDNVNKAITITRHLADPEIAKAKTLQEAFKILENKENLKKHALHAAIVGESFGAHLHKALLGDCLVWMSEMDANQFDVILSDPPYGMGADEFGDAGGKLTGTTHEYKDDAASFQVLIAEALYGISRVAKPAAHLYLCCDIDQFHFLRTLIHTVGGGWKVFRTPLINYKLGGGRVPLPEHGPRRSYELVLYAFRGDKRVTAIYPDVIESKGDTNLGHGAQKPVGLFADLLVRSVRAGDRVLDPFAGTGTVFPAAHGLKCIATGIEKDPAYYGIAVKRLEELT